MSTQKVNHSSANTKRCTTANESDPQIQVIEKKEKVSFLFRLSNDPSRCYRFINDREGKLNSLLLCVSCHVVNGQRRTKGLERYPSKHYRSDGYYTTDDPMKYHFRECEGYLYSDVIAGGQYALLEDEKIPEGNGFPLVRTKRTGQFGVVYRLPSDLSKCYHFQYEVKQRGGTVLFCVTCTALQKNVKESYGRRAKYHCGSEGFREDPLLNHVNGCKPLSYKNIMESYEQAIPKAAEKFLRFNDARPNAVVAEVVEIPRAEDMLAGSKSEFPVFCLDNKVRSISYVYHLPEKEGTCYRFCGNKYNNGVNLSCVTCQTLHRRNKINITVIARNSDGFSMKFDPRSDHLPGCEPLQYSEVQKKYCRLTNDENIVGVYDFPVERVQRIEAPFFLYILKEDPTKCYRYQFQIFRPRKVLVATNCVRCAIIKRTRPKTKSENETNIQASKNCRFDGFLMDPRQGHFEGCQPFEYSDVMKDYVFTDEKRARVFFQTGLITNIQENRVMDKQKSTGKPIRTKNNRVQLSGTKRKCSSSKGTDLKQEPAAPSSTSQSSETDQSSLMARLWKAVSGDSLTEEMANEIKNSTEIKSQINAHEMETLEDVEALPVINKNKRRYKKDKSTVKVSTPNKRNQFSNQENLENIPTEQDHLLNNVAKFEISPKFETEVEKLLPITYEPEEPEMCDSIERKSLKTRSNIHIIWKSEPTDTILLKRTRISNAMAFRESQNFEPSGVAIKEEVFDEFYEDVKPTTEVKKEADDETITISVEIPQTFEKVLDVSFFREDEIQIRIEDGRVIVECEREVSALSVTGGILRYSLLLPNFVDISTLKTEWTGQEIVILATRIIN